MVSPLAESGMDKAAIRAAARAKTSTIPIGARGPACSPGWPMVLRRMRTCWRGWPLPKKRCQGWYYRSFLKLFRPWVTCVCGLRQPQCFRWKRCPGACGPGAGDSCPARIYGL